MRSGARIAATLLIAVSLSSLPARSGAESSPERPALAERYLVNGDKSQIVTVTRLARDVYQVVGKGWDGVGLLSSTKYWGVFRQAWGSDSSKAPGTRGTHRGVLRPDGALAIHGEYTFGLTGSFDVVWAPERGAPLITVTDPGQLPRPNDYVYVEELPEALTKVPPQYPDDARKARVEGTVMVQALVGRDGRVKETKVVRSIPLLDQAAMDAVRQWVFKPALAKGQPVEVWVATPVRFTLH